LLDEPAETLVAAVPAKAVPAREAATTICMMKASRCKDNQQLDEIARVACLWNDGKKDFVLNLKT
jgi:hypothetical protein